MDDFTAALLSVSDIMVQAFELLKLSVNDKRTATSNGLTLKKPAVVNGMYLIPVNF